MQRFYNWPDSSWSNRSYRSEKQSCSFLSRLRFHHQKHHPTNTCPSCINQAISLLPKLLLAIALLLLFPFLTSPTSFVIAEYQSWYGHLQETKSLRWPGFRDAWYGWLVFEEQLHPGNFNDQLWSIPTNSLYKLLQFLTGFATTALVLFWRTKAADKVELISRAIALGMIWILLFGPASEFPTFAFIAPF